jgi:hypothetical protein
VRILHGNSCLIDEIKSDLTSNIRTKRSFVRAVAIVVLPEQR